MISTLVARLQLLCADAGIAFRTARHTVPKGTAVAVLSDFDVRKETHQPSDSATAVLRVEAVDDTEAGLEAVSAAVDALWAAAASRPGVVPLSARWAGVETQDGMRVSAVDVELKILL